MAIISIVMLLAACSTSVIAGPVPQNPRRQLFTSYANTSLTASSTTDVIQASSSANVVSTFLRSSESPIALSTLLSKALPLSAPNPEQTVNADTALVVEPIQQTVFTHIIPAITFLNPKGEPLVTEDPQTILSTSYITPTPAPTTEESSSTTPTPSITPSQASMPTESSTIALSSNINSEALSTSVAAVENGTASTTSQRAPMFTYSPEGEETRTPLASPTLVSASISTTSEQSVPSSGGLPGFEHPGSASRSIQVTSPAANSTIATISSVAVPESSANSSSPSSPLGSPTGNPAPALTSEGAESTTHLFVTTTEYTTVYPSSTPSDVAPSVPQASTLEPAAPTEAQNTLSAQQTSSQVAASPALSAQPQESAAPALSSATAALPTSPLDPPPFVIVTQYTTVTPTSGSSPTESPSTPSSATSSPAYANPSSSSSTAEPSSTSPAASPSTSPAAPPPPSSTSETAQPAPAPTETPSIPVPEPAPSSTTSEGPLIITPIAPSQIFTVTVTTTEKETIRETATVTVTA
ncbi:Nn.00g109670.m01.CDS01 [Neocucurbitaria sp. VM-36]